MPLYNPKVTPGGSDTQVQFNDGGVFGGDAGLTYNKTTDKLTLAGQLDLSGAAAGQIVFPASQNASSNANTLDDFEEGNWTPVIGGSGGTSGQSYTTQVGKYLKTGRCVYISCTVQLSTKGTITSAVQIQGLPFACENTTGYQPFFLCAWGQLATTWVDIGAYMGASGSVLNIEGATAASTSLLAAALATTDLNNTAIFRVTGLYFTAS